MVSLVLLAEGLVGLLAFACWWRVGLHVLSRARGLVGLPGLRFFDCWGDCLFEFFCLLGVLAGVLVRSLACACWVACWLSC